VQGATAALDVDSYSGKVIYLYGFQSWCPGCHARGFPTLQKLIKRFEDEDDVVFVAVQTTFEGFDTNTPAKALSTAKRYDLKIPIGHSGAAGKPSPLMRHYRSGGTPWTIIIDRSGIVRFNDFHITPDAGETLMKQLLAEAAPTRVQTLPTERGGQDRIGKKFPKIPFSRWLLAAPKSSPPKTRTPPRLTLYRWWTDACGFCHASLPAMELLRKKYGEDGLRVVAVYHPKPPRAVEGTAIRAAAASLGFHGDIAVDESWHVLREAYLDSGQRAATSISLLVDEQGVIRFVHPGPVLFPSTDPEDVTQNNDFVMLESAIEKVLNDAKAKPTPHG
jgi:thiol-disulfide isomerase/thioredoxin